MTWISANTDHDDPEWKILDYSITSSKLVRHNGNSPYSIQFGLCSMSFLIHRIYQYHKQHGAAKASATS